jgi:hypothetical protein
MSHTGTPGHGVQDALDREVALVSSAVDLVASGGATATTVAGLRLTDLVIEIVKPRADRAGVVIEPLWGGDESTSDVRVRRLAAT